MSNFELRDSLAAADTSSQFSGRVADVFAGLGSGQVKSDKDNDEKMRKIKEAVITKLCHILKFYSSNFMEIYFCKD